MKNRNHAVSLLLVIMVCCPLTFQAQVRGQEADLKPRNIRARKLAQYWQGETVQITLADDHLVVGRFVGADFYNYTLESKNKHVVFPIGEITTVTIKPGLIEAVIALLAGALGGGLGGSIAALTVPDAGIEGLASAAALGAAVGL